MNKLEKQDEKLRKAIEAGAGMVEISISKIKWDLGQDRIKVVGGKLDYRVLQVLDCAADRIAQEYWYGTVISNWESERTEEPKHFIVPIPCSYFKLFIRDKQNLDNKDVIEIFKRVPKVVLDGKTKVPCCLADGKWMDIDFYEDNICGVAVAKESKRFEEQRSDRKQRGKGAGEEEPVLILLFSNVYGRAFFRQAMRRKGTQILSPDLYHLHPEAQELFQAVRWNNGLIALNTEQISKIVDWIWPPKNFYDRVYRIRRLLEILYKNKFINKAAEEGKSIEKKAWIFYTRKRRVISYRQNDN